jgi:tetratricopeptide (TPR) repeat protein
MLDHAVSKDTAETLTNAAGEGLSLIGETVKGGIHSLVINPYNSAVQLADSASRNLFDQDLGWSTTDALAADPKATGARAVARAIGESGGTIIQFMALSAGLRALPGVSGALAGTEAQALSVPRLGLTGGAGFVQGSLLTPLNNGESEWHRLAHGGASALSFTAMDVGPGLVGRGLNRVGFANAAASVMTNPGRLMVGGGIGAAVDVQADKLFTTGQPASLSDTLTATAGGVIAGGVFHVVGSGISDAKPVVMEALRSAKNSLAEAFQVPSFYGPQLAYAGAASYAMPHVSAVSENFAGPLMSQAVALSEVAPQKLSQPVAPAEARTNAVETVPAATPVTNSVESIPAATATTNARQLELQLGDNPIRKSETVKEEPRGYFDEQRAESDARTAKNKILLASKDEAMTLAKTAQEHRRQGRIDEADETAARALKLAGIDANDPRGSLRNMLRPRDYLFEDKNDAKVSHNALNVFATAYGIDHPTFVSAIESLSKIKLGLHDDEMDHHQAAPLLGKLIDSRKVRFGPDDPRVGDALMQMAAAHKYSGAWPDALPAIARATEIKLAAPGANKAQAIDALLQQGDIADSASRYDQSALAFSRALKLIDNSNDSVHLKVNALNGLADAYLQSGRSAEAGEAVQKVLDIAKTTILDRGDTSKTLKVLGRLYLGAGQVDQGIEYYRLAGRHAPPLPRRLPDMKPVPALFKDEITPTSNPYLSLFQHLDREGMLADRGLRWGVVQKYSWWVPNDEALDAIAKEGKILLVGAGTGYDAALLKARGVDILPVDANPAESGRSYYHSGGRSWTNILEGTESVVPQYPDRTLMLAWPPERYPFTKKPHPMAYNALNSYNGNTLIYIGDEEVTGDKRFHDLLNREWQLDRWVEIPRWDDIRDYLNIYRRRDARLQF